MFLRVFVVSVYRTGTTTVRREESPTVFRSNIPNGVHRSVVDNRRTVEECPAQDGGGYYEVVDLGNFRVSAESVHRLGRDVDVGDTEQSQRIVGEGAPEGVLRDAGESDD